MKPWFGAAGRFCLDFFLILLLSAVIALLGHKPELRDLSWILPTCLAAVLTYYPLAAVIALGLGFYAFEGRLGSRRRFLAWLSVLVLGFGVLAGMTTLRRILPGEAIPLETQAPGPELKPGIIQDYPTGGLYAREIQGQTARGLVRFEAEAPSLGKLSYKDELPLAQALEAVPPRQAKEASRGSLGFSLSLSRLSALDSLSYPLALGALGGFALLGAGLAGFTRVPRWPLVGVFFGAAAVLGLFALDGLLASPEVRDLASPLLQSLPLRLPWPLWVSMAEGLLGVIVAGLTLPSWSRREE